jgi:hypothetical protein
LPTNGFGFLRIDNGCRANVRVSKKKRKAKAGSNRFGNRRLSRTEKSARLGLLLFHEYVRMVSRIAGQDDIPGRASGSPAIHCK